MVSFCLIVNPVAYFTEYNITVAPKTGGGLGPRVLTTVMSGQGPPSSPPSLTAINPVSSRVIQVTWESPPEETHNGKLERFILRWRTHDKMFNKQLPSGDRSHTITGLTPYTEYNISISAMTEAPMPGPYSEENLTRTDQDSEF